MAAKILATGCEIEKEERFGGNRISPYLSTIGERQIAMNSSKAQATTRQHSFLCQLRDSKSEPPELRQRAAIILAADAGKSNTVIAWEVGLHERKVGHWKQEWRWEWERLISIESNSPELLPEAIRYVLSDKRQNGVGRGGSSAAVPRSPMDVQASEP